MASPQPGASPISKLHDEILWSIFQFNSPTIDHYVENNTLADDLFTLLSEDPGLESPLVINRKTSQVCRRWRRVIVNSPSIWANGIDLGHLDQNGDEWRNEVLKRTGNAPLTVIGRIGEDESLPTDFNCRARRFFLNLLDAHWNRMRSLIIASYDATIDERLCTASSRPAPNLESLIISYSRFRHVGNNGIPFAKHAPRLRKLCIDGLPLNISEPSWSSNIRHLNIAWSQRDMSIAELLHSLENMTFLQTLRLFDTTPTSDTGIIRPNGRTPTITLSNLRKFTVQESNSAILDLIPCIIIPRQCTFEVETDFDDFAAEVPERVAFSYATFFKHNFPPADVTNVSYSLQCANVNDNDSEDGFDNDEADDMYDLSISVGGSTQSQSTCPYFKYSASLMGVNGTPFRMAGALSSFNLDNVTTLTLSLTVHNHASILEHPLFESMYDFLLAFQSVETLYTDEDTLALYMGSEDLCVTNVLFPRLVNVFTDLWDTGITRFLDYRCNNANEQVQRIKRVVFKEDTIVPCGNSSVVIGARMFGVTVGWQGRSIRKVSFADDGVLEFAP